jgi:hypothetical protein
MLATRLTDLVKVYDDVFPIERCEELVKLFHSHPDRHQRYDRNSRPNFTQFNLSEFDASEDATEEEKILHRDLTTMFMNVISLYQIDCSITDEIPSQWGLEQIRIKKYDTAKDCCDPSAIETADQFAEHVDVGDYNSARRFLALFLYLNPTDATGQTTFPYLDLKVDPLAGRILVFPPMWMYPHAGLPTFSVPKYIIGTYCHYL